MTAWEVDGRAWDDADAHSSDVPFAVDTAVFDGHEWARFWIGIVASGTDVIHPELFEAYGILRARVYIDRLGILGPEYRDECGRESDGYDDRSVHFLVVENDRVSGSKRAIGCSRLVFKSGELDRLPIELTFPEVFEAAPAGVGSGEVSRLISIHEDEFTQHKTSLALMRAMTFHGLSTGGPMSYFQLEAHLQNLLDLLGFPVREISPAKEIREYASTASIIPVEMDPRLIIDSVRLDKTRQLVLSQFFGGEELSGGLGHYRGSFLGSAVDLG